MRTSLLRITQATLSSSISLHNKFNYFMTILITFLLISKPVVIEAKVSPSTLSAESTTSNEDSKLGLTGKQCNIYENEALHAVMDRVCELCHDMFSHQSPNMRANCRFVVLCSVGVVVTKNTFLKCNETNFAILAK